MRKQSGKELRVLEGRKNSMNKRQAKKLIKRINRASIISFELAERMIIRWNIKTKGMVE